MINVKDLVLLAICSSLIIVSKFALMFIPNIELVTFLLIIYTVILGFKKALIIAVVFTVIDAFIGIGTHLYIWTLIVVLTNVFKGLFKENFLMWAIYSGFLGLIFGFLSSIPYIIIADFNYAISYFFSGFILFDIPHMLGNYFFMLLIGKTAYINFKKLTDAYLNKNGGLG